MIGWIAIIKILQWQWPSIYVVFFFDTKCFAYSRSSAATGSGGILVIIFPGGGSRGHPVRTIHHKNYIISITKLYLLFLLSSNITFFLIETYIVNYNTVKLKKKIPRETIVQEFNLFSVTARPIRTFIACTNIFTIIT